MTSQPIASGRPAPGPARHRRPRTVAAIAAVAALTAIGGYLATNRVDTAPPAAVTDTEVHASAQKLRELRQSIAGQYGRQSAAGATVNPSAQTLRKLHQSIASQYGSQATPNAVLNPSSETLRELRQSIAGQYGPAR